jgi:hypothetical protein
VRPVECDGRDYKFVAFLGYQRYLVKVNSRKVLEGTLNEIQREKEMLQAECDWNKGKYVQVKTRLQDIAAHFMGALRDDEPEPLAVSDYAPKRNGTPMAKALDNMERDLLHKPPPAEAPVATPPVT